ncbi:hypothetical protein F5B17DRAFT_102251 [Nemania serpens]|nr:hypothetical protein F5B17DRAFT_102251 [Nemania serpens]
MPIKNKANVNYTNPIKRSNSADQAVMNYASTSPNIQGAVIRSIPAHAGGDTWHTGGTDPNAKEHITVEFKDAAGNHITTKHIDRNGKAC